MRCALATLVVLFATVARGADDAPKATGKQAGISLTFPDAGLADGVKAAVGLLESCSDESLYQVDELGKTRQGDHVCLVFPKPVAVLVLGEKVGISELVFRRPLNTGVFWVRTGDTWRRYTKYDFQKVKPLETWLGQARPTKGS